MARELADVIHFFLDEPAQAELAAAPLLAVPIGEKEPLRLAFLWNLAVELARRGARPSLLVPEATTMLDQLPPRAVGGVLAPELVISRARKLPELESEAVRTVRPGRREGLRLAAVPTEWIGAETVTAGCELLGWTLLFSRADPSELDATGCLARRVAEAAPEGVVGVTIHAVESVAEARAAFDRLAVPFEAATGRLLRSYSLLLDDLLVYRGAAERRPVVLSHPRSLAARALADLAGLVLADASELGTSP